MLLKIETTTASDGGAAVRTTCDTCSAAPSTVYCYTDLAYLCAGCDARIHAAALHYGVGVCDSCERAPAAFLCKADSASLCAACDADIHSANPLARRHHRVPVQPTLFGPLAANHGGLLLSPSENAEDEFLCGDIEEDEDEAASWLLLNPIKNDDDEDDDDDELSTDANAPPLFGGEVDEYLDLDDYNSCENKQFNEGCNNQQQHYSVPQISYGGDSVVPIQYQKGKNHSHNLCFDLAYTYPASISQTVSISSLDVDVVPESTSEVSMSYTRAHKGTIDQFLISPPMQMPAQLSPMDREARVVRYREKKKMRKFEKTIRYASRKAYAETRPRVKGRFAKRRDAEVEVDQMFTSASLMLDTAYGVVPSF